MYLDRNTSLGFISALALTVALGCSSKKDNTDNGGGGVCSFNCGGNTGGASNGGAGNGIIDPSKICDGMFANQTCAADTVGQLLKTPNMLIVIDESGSMNQKSSAASASTKWGEMRQALTAALSVQKVRSNINFGLELFPNSGDPNAPIDPNDSNPTTSCAVPGDTNVAIEVPIETGTDKVNTILAAVNGAAPAGGTPTNRALQQAYTYFTTSPGKDLVGDKFVLLATDGGPNCNSGLSCTKESCTQNMDLLCGDHTVNTKINCCDGAGYICLDDVATVGEINNLAAAGIKTYVVGIPGSEAYSTTLDEMATAGQAPNTMAGATHQYYAVSASNSLADLQAAFEDITTKLVTSCDIPLTKSPTDISQVQVAIECQKINQVAPDAGTGGFFVDYSFTPAHIQLVGSTCSNMQLNGAREVDIVVGCRVTQ